MFDLGATLGLCIIIVGSITILAGWISNDGDVAARVIIIGAAVSFFLLLFCAISNGGKPDNKPTLQKMIAAQTAASEATITCTVATAEACPTPTISVKCICVDSKCSCNSATATVSTTVQISNNWSKK
jgi:hypothetical protein